MSGASVLLFALAATTPSGAPAPAAPPATTVAGAEAFPRKDVPPLVKEVYQKGFPYCTDANYPLTRDEHDWCALFPKPDDRCPALARVCTGAATAEMVGQHGRQSTDTTINVPVAPLPFRALLWIMLAVAAAVIIYSIARHVVSQRAPEREQAVEIATEAPEDPAAAIARQVETDVQRLLERARVAAAAGDFGAAVDDAYAALLRKLEGAGIVTIESHRTNGDHVRDVGRQLPTLRPRLQSVVTNVEEVQFGGAAPSEGRFRSVMGDVLGLLSEKLAGVLPILVKLGLGLALAGLVSGCRINRDSWDRSPSGRAGVVDLLERYGFTPRERLASLSKIDGSVSALVLLPGAEDVEASWPSVANWVAEGGTLIVAGGKRSLPSWIGVTIAGDKATPAASAPLTIPSGASERLPKLKVVVPSRHEVQLAVSVSRSEDGSEEAPPLILLTRDKANYAVERTYEGGGRTIVLADDLLLTNASLLVDDNARALIELLRPGGPKLEFAGELTGLVSKSPMTSVQRGRLAPAMLQLQLLLLLFFAYKGAHFGRPIDPITTTRRRFSEHARAIGLRYARNRAGRHALEIYGSYALERLRERLNLMGGKSLLAVAEELATRTGRPLGEVMRVLVESRPVKRDGDPERERILQEANSVRDLATMRDIASLLQHGTQGGSKSPPAASAGRQTQPSLVAITTGGSGERSGSEGQA